MGLTEALQALTASTEALAAILKEWADESRAALECRQPQ